MAPRTSTSTRDNFIRQLRALAKKANTRGMDGAALLLTTTALAIERGGEELLEFAVWSKNEWRKVPPPLVEGQPAQPSPFGQLTNQQPTLAPFGFTGQGLRPVPRPSESEGTEG